MATFISDPKKIAEMMDDTIVEQKRLELKNFLKVCEHRPELLHSICSISAVDGHSLDPECCAPISDTLLHKAMTRCVETIVAGCKMGSKDGQFSNGGFGSRWLDLDHWAQENGLDHCRCAFYSKKFSKVWKQDKPYAIRLTVEKGK